MAGNVNDMLITYIYRSNREAIMVNNKILFQLYPKDVEFYYKIGTKIFV